MKRVFAIILTCALLPVSALARGDGSEAYICEIIREDIPTGCVYVDMLIPIEAEDENYTEYNAANGVKNGISQMSEIVKYNNHGFQSYTFHMKTARSIISPYKDNYEKFCAMFLADESEYDINVLTQLDAFGKKYKKAKFAYLDADGNIIAVTNEVDIRNEKGYMDIYITLSGEEAMCEMYGGIRTAEWDVVGILFGVCIGISLMILSTVLIARHRRKRRLTESIKMYGDADNKIS